MAKKSTSSSVRRLIIASLIGLLNLNCSTAHVESIEKAAVMNTDKDTTQPSEDHGVETSRIKVVFSDVDGTLVHYPENIPDDPSLILLPPSKTGMRGIISRKTLQYCSDLRSRGVKLVLVSGMRTTTLLDRLPYLPKADAYCSEGGGRVFYLKDDRHSEQDSSVSPDDLVEDMEWRRRMESDVGTDGYDGNTLDDLKSVPIPVNLRKGELWKYAASLEQKGLVLDTKGYSTCFRVNRKHQQDDVTFDDFSSNMNLFKGLASSVNLGCIDIFPLISGKKNCCEYLAGRFTNSNDNPLKSCVCICDDDNDLEMAEACSHAFIPSISSESMARQIEKHSDQFTVTTTKGIETVGTELSLERILKRIA